MWRISYLNLDNDEIQQKGGFKSDKEAEDWKILKESEGKIIGLKLLVWSELLQCYRIVYEYNQYQ